MNDCTVQTSISDPGKTEDDDLFERMIALKAYLPSPLLQVRPILYN